MRRKHVGNRKAIDIGRRYKANLIGRGFPVPSSLRPLAGGQRNDRVYIAAAAAGEAVYAGNSVPGFGNLVLICHGGWVTAYAHLDNLNVKMRKTVTQGQKIGEACMTGGVCQPQPHFEAHYNPTTKDKAKPIGPMRALPSGGGEAAISPAAQS